MSSEKSYTKEEIKQLISKANKKLRDDMKMIVEFNSQSTGPQTSRKIEKVIKNFNEEDTAIFNSLMLVINGILKRRDTLFLAMEQMTEIYNSVISSLREIGHYEDKVLSLNSIALNNPDEAAKIAKLFKMKSKHCSIKLKDGTYNLEVKGLKLKIQKDRRDFKETMEEAKTLLMCLDNYLEEYQISDIIPPDVQKVKEGIKKGYSIDKDLMYYYKRYVIANNSDNGNLFACMNNRILEDEDEVGEEPFFTTYEDAKPIESYLSYGLFSI